MILYNYMPPESICCVLGTGKLRYVNPATFNDPYDCQFDLYPEYNPPEVTDTIRRKLWDYYIARKSPSPRLQSEFGKLLSNLLAQPPQLRKEEFYECSLMQHVMCCVAMEIKRYTENGLRLGQDSARAWRRNAVVFCLSEDFDNKLMWSHYAKKHEGIVLGFSVSNDCHLQKAAPVRYQKKLPVLLTQDQVADSILGELDTDDPNFFKEIANRQILTKEICWSYEKEWRVVLDRCKLFSDTNEVYLPFETGALKEVYIGCRANGETFNKTILLAAQYQNTHVFKVKKPERKYDFECEQIM